MKCLRCGRNGVISPYQPICFDCLVKVYPRLRFDRDLEGFGRPQRLHLIEDDGDVKIYEPIEKALSRRA